MNRHSIIYIATWSLLVTMAFIFTSCEDGDGIPLEEPDGSPKISYIRVTDPEKSDSLLVGAQLGQLIAIVGENLGGTREVWFNDRQADITPSWVTNETIIVTVPNSAPSQITDEIRLVNDRGGVLRHNFVINISAPILSNMRNEYAKEGSTTTITGNYFFEPISVLFGNLESEVTVIDQNTIEVVVPEGAPAGPLTVKTNFGSGISSFHYRDQRNVFLNYDDPAKTPSGSWRPGLFIEDENSIDGAYIRFKGVYSADNPRNEGPVGDDHYESQFWAGTSGKPESSLIPDGNPGDYVMKFEVNVVEWYASYLNICFAGWGHANSNQEIWANDINPRAYWGPWDDANDTYTTNGEWETVTIPLSDFVYEMGMDGSDVVYTSVPFGTFDPSASAAGSLSFWVLAAPQADNSPFEFYIDNVRIVSK